MSELHSMASLEYRIIDLDFLIHDTSTAICGFCLNRMLTHGMAETMFEEPRSISNCSTPRTLACGLISLAHLCSRTSTCAPKSHSR